MLYRAYFIDQYEHIRSARDISARTGEEAVLRAKQLAHGHAVEVWQISKASPHRASMLGRFGPNAA